VPDLLMSPPYSEVEPITDVLHGVSVTDPYRWLEDQNSPKTRAWIEQQTTYARSYLDSLPGRERIRERIREFLAVETYDSVLIAGNTFYFRKRLADQEQPCIYARVGVGGEDQLLLDPAERGSGKYTAVKPICVSPYGRLLLYEVKQGGERTGTFELLDIATRTRLPDSISRGYLRGFAFAPDGKSFYYVHEPLETNRPFYRAAYKHVLGTPLTEDQEIFFAGEDQNIRLSLLADRTRLVYYVSRFLNKRYTDIYLQYFDSPTAPVLIFESIQYRLGLRLLNEKILAITDRDAPNRRIVELRLHEDGAHEWIDVVPESDSLIRSWFVTRDCIAVSYFKQMAQQLCLFDFIGNKAGEIPIGEDQTLRIIGSSPDSDALLFETEGFAEPISVLHLEPANEKKTVWSTRRIPFDSSNYAHSRVCYQSKDGTTVPMFLVGRRDVLERSNNTTIMTAYGGYGNPMTPLFSVFVAYLMERGCLFALPNIRGGSEFGPEWHQAAKRRTRQVAFDDFLCAGEWLVRNGRTAPNKLAIFGGSNSGLLVGAALTQRPEMFRAVVCMVPLLDMLRYHLYDNAHVWIEEFGSADHPEDFEALAAYSPYHHVRCSTPFPAVMLVSGDADRNCNPLHARKMTARLQAANTSDYPILIDYSELRGHSPVLPLTERINALTDRMAFLCAQLQLSV
jgi:prolyl oligopeptidase